ncbi:MAG: hypothetical protein AB2A00_26050 [Myxococcota bacterium]
MPNALRSVLLACLTVSLLGLGAPAAVYAQGLPEEAAASDLDDELELGEPPRAPAPRSAVPQRAGSLWDAPFQRVLLLSAVTTLGGVGALVLGAALGSIPGATMMLMSLQQVGRGDPSGWSVMFLGMMAAGAGAALGAVVGYVLARALLPWVTPLPGASLFPRKAADTPVALVFNVVDGAAHVALVTLVGVLGAAPWALWIGALFLTAGTGGAANPAYACLGCGYYILPFVTGAAVILTPLGLVAANATSPVMALLIWEQVTYGMPPGGLGPFSRRGSATPTRRPQPAQDQLDEEE